MSRINLKIFKLSWWQLLLGVVLFWFILVLWPVKGLLWPGNWWGQSLIVVMNDNEARPCGGFATAYGVLRLPLLSLDVQNSYALNADLGPSPKPLDQVSDRLRFWDLGTSSELSQCAEAFKNGYRANTDTEVDRVILVQMHFLEHWAKALGKNRFFADISRDVANVDRHDEASLENRKSLATPAIKEVILGTMLKPFTWRELSRDIQNARQNKEIFWSSPRPQPKSSERPTASISEWNLGGGKSSRYLRKSWSVDIKEDAAGDFRVTLKMIVDHLGGYDEPLSQTWRGGFAFNFLDLEVFIPAEIEPGTRWVYTETYDADISDIETLQIFVPPAQDWHTNFSLAVFPQQTLSSKILETRESIGTWSGNLPAEGLEIDWEIAPDSLPPFMTLHTVVAPNVPESIAVEYLIEDPDKTYFYGEIHFNEIITLTENFEVVITDRNFANTELSQDPILSSHILLPDQQTLILQFKIIDFQKDERFYVALAGVEDLFGNKIEEVQRTLITR